MKPEESNHITFFIDEITGYEAEIKQKKAPDAVERQQCPNCAKPQPEEAEPETSEEKVRPEEAPVTVEKQKCSNCTEPQSKEELLLEQELYCACSPSDAVGHGALVTPEQVLAQYNSRPPMLIKANPGRPVYAVHRPINTNPGHPGYAFSRRSR